MDYLKIKISFIIIGVLVGLCGCSQGEAINLEAEIVPVMYDRDAIVTIISDDGDVNTRPLLNELSAKHKMKTTIAGIVYCVEPSMEEWQEVEKEGNIELISHSTSHVKMGEEDGIEEDELRHQITDSIQLYKENFKTDQIAFVPPENTMCSKGYDILKENGIYAVRQGARGANSLSPEEGTSAGQWYNLYMRGIGDVMSMEERNQWIDAVIEDRQWLIEMWHNITLSGSEGGYQEISYEMADEHMGYMEEKEKQGKIWVAPFTDAVKYIWEREHSEVKAWYDGRAIKVNLQCQELPEEIFDFPVTIKIVMPDEIDDWKTKQFNLKNGEELRVIEDGQRWYLEFEMVPNEKNLTIKIS